MWNNQLETAQESKIALKTRFDHWEKVKKVILDNHSYDIPEITYEKIDGGNLPYMDWLVESTSEMSQSKVED
jgi:periplasmic divalent cation tolerance protein